MKLSISNIAWDASEDSLMYGYLQEMGFEGLEIAPTRIFPENPYEHLREAESFAENLQKNYGLEISSMQSIWYGQTGQVFGTVEEREALLAYTKKAIDFAEIIGCRNLVFGCPKNRVGGNNHSKVAVEFFGELGRYALQHHTVLAMEANPAIYHTDYINQTSEALRLIEEVNSPGFLLNLDLGTMIENKESVAVLKGSFDKINHVHISEPYLECLQERSLHQELADSLKDAGYSRFVSVEMKKQEQQVLRETVKYVCRLIK